MSGQSQEPLVLLFGLKNKCRCLHLIKVCWEVCCLFLISSSQNVFFCVLSSSESSHKQLFVDLWSGALVVFRRLPPVAGISVVGPPLEQACLQLSASCTAFTKNRGHLGMKLSLHKTLGDLIPWTSDSSMPGCKIILSYRSDSRLYRVLRIRLCWLTTTFARGNTKLFTLVCPRTLVWLVRTLGWPSKCRIHTGQTTKINCLPIVQSIIRLRAPWTSPAHHRPLFR